MLSGGSFLSDGGSEGGRLFSEGLYGCMFTPPLTCRKGTEKVLDDEEKGLQLTKLIPVMDANQEFAVSKRIHRIPFYKQYFAVAEEICEPESVQKDKDIADCPVWKDHNAHEARLLRMPYYGKALHDVTFSVSSFDFRTFMTHLLAGGALMNLFGVVHRDLHQGNILVDTYNVPRIIDFNLSFTAPFERVKAKDLSHRYDYTIAQEPPDSTLINALYHGRSASEVIQSLCFRKRVMNKISSLLGVSKRDMYAQLMRFYQRSRVMQTGDMERWFQLYYRVIDSWAVGVCLVDLVHKLMLWPAFAAKMEAVMPRCRPILRKLCAVHPMERIDCVQALYLMDSEHPVIRRYGKRWLDVVGYPTR